MADFSIGEALGAGFGLIRRRPGSVLAWGLTYLLLGVVLPFGLMLWALGPDFFHMISNLPPGPVSGAEASKLFPVPQVKLVVVEPVMMLAPLVVQTVLMAAVFRAVLEPRNRGFAYMRLGRREWWLGLVLLVASILAMMVMMVVEIVGLGTGLMLNLLFETQHLGWPIRIAAFVALGLLLLVGFLGVAVRFALALPMTFSEGRFLLFESWELTRGRGWKLFALALLASLLGLVVILLFEGLIVGGVMMAAGLLHLGPGDFQEMARRPEMLWRSGIAEGLVAAAIVLALAMGALFAINIAPWAVAYRELLPRSKPSPREGGLYVPAPPPPEPAEPEVRDQPPADHDHGHADPHADSGERGH